MKRLSSIVLFLLVLQIFIVGAYDITVNSASEQTIILAVTDLNTVDIQLSKVVATVETETISDTYTVDATTQRDGNEVFISIDITPIFQDYSSEEVQAITVSGIITVDGEDIDFGKRVPYRGASSSENNLQGAPALNEGSTTLIYSIVSLCLILVFLILILFYNKPKHKVVAKKEKKKQGKKRKIKKKVKKSKKRL